MLEVGSYPYGEPVAEEPAIFEDLQPFEIKKIGDKFIAHLPVAGSSNAKGADSVDAYATISFSSEEEAYRAVAEARKDLGLKPLN